MTSRSPQSLHRLLRQFCSTVSYLRGKSDHSQLQMQLEQLDYVPDYSLPSGYSIRTYLKSDDPYWIGIIQEAFGKNIPEPPQITLKNILIKPDFDAKSLFFAIFKDIPIGTICALTFSTGETKTGYIHMVAVSPNHQGKKLGRALTLEALQYLKKKGIQRVTLDTDDFRIQAIKTYRNIGFKPIYLDLSHRKRWSKILKGLKTINHKKQAFIKHN